MKILKTYKLFIGGKFPRTESGRFFKLSDKKGNYLANVSRASRKDVRDAVSSARKGLESWNNCSAFNRSQIFYRVAEMLDAKRGQFLYEMILQGYSKKNAQKEIDNSIDRLLYYSGWCDKYQALFSSVNPVSSSHYNFSVLEPTGVVALIADNNSGLIGLVSLLAPILCGANTCVVLASEKYPLSSVSLSEVFATSDVPHGVINVLTGFSKELVPHLSSHMDINAVVYSRDSKSDVKCIKENAALNIKRVFIHKNINWMKESSQSPYFILDTQELKTTWHPVENMRNGGKAY